MKGSAKKAKIQKNIKMSQPVIGALKPTQPRRACVPNSVCP